MDTRRFRRYALLAAMLLASGAACANAGDTAADPRDLFATARQTLRAATQLIRVHTPAAPVTTSVTNGVRG